MSAWTADEKLNHAKNHPIWVNTPLSVEEQLKPAFCATCGTFILNKPYVHKCGNLAQAFIDMPVYPTI